MEIEENKGEKYSKHYKYPAMKYSLEESGFKLNVD